MPNTAPGTGADGTILFNGSSSVPHTTRSGSVYSLTGDINATSITVNSGVTVKTCNWKLLCNGPVVIRGTVHNNGGDGGDGVAGSSSGTGGTGGSNTTNSSNGGSLLAGIPGTASTGGGGSEPGAGPGGDSVVGTGTSSTPGGNGGAGGNVLSGISAGSGEAGGSGAQGGGGGGGGGHVYFLDTPAQGGGGGGAGGYGGPVFISGDSITVAAGATVSANGGNGGNGGDGKNGTVGPDGGGGGGGGGTGGEAGSIEFVYGTLSIAPTATVEAAGGAGGTGGKGGAPAGDGTPGGDGQDAPSGSGGSVPVQAMTIIGHGANLNRYDNGGYITPIFPPGHGELFQDLEPMRNWCRANGIGAAGCLDSQRSAKDFLDSLFIQGNSAPVYSGDYCKVIPYDEVSAADNGAIYVAPTSSGPIADLTDKDYAKDGFPTFVRKRRTSCDNAISIEHVDRSLDYATRVTSDADAMAVSLYGPRKGGQKDSSIIGQRPPSGAITLPMLTDATQAQKIASIQTKRNSAGVNQYSFKLTSQWMHLEAMDLVTLTDARLGLDQLPVRLVSVKEGDDRTLECVADQFVYGLNHPDVKNTTDATGTLVQVNVDPGLVNAPIMFEPPSAMSATGNNQLWFDVSGSDPNYGGCIPFVSVDGAGGTYNALGGQIGPCITGVLTADYPDSSSDPDTTDTLSVDLSESLGSLSSQPTAIADGFANPCYVSGEATVVTSGGSSDYPGAGPSAGTDYYVATTGSDSTGDGSAGNPWATITHASAHVAAGDIVHVADGTYGPVTTGVSGNSSNYVTFKAVSKWGAKIVSTSGYPWSNKGSYVNILGFDVSGAGTSGIANNTDGSGSSYVNIIGNYVHDMNSDNGTGNGGAGINVDIGYYNSGHCQVIGNYVKNIGTGSPYGSTLASSIHGIYLATANNYVANNIVEHISGWGIQNWHYATDNIIVNNTLLKCQDGGIVVGSSSTTIANCKIVNNIFYQNRVGLANETSGSGAIGSGNVYDHNLFYGQTVANTSMSSGQTVTNSVTTNPNFVSSSDFHLIAGSPAIDAGTTTNAPTYDFDGGSRPVGSYDIGAYEYGATVSGGTTTTTTIAGGYEVICYTDVNLTSNYNYDLDTYIRRAVQTTQHMDHPSGARFGVLNGNTYKVDVPQQWIGKTVWFKFAAFNKLGGQVNDLSTCVAYPYSFTGGPSAEVYVDGVAISFDDTVYVDGTQITGTIPVTVDGV